ncbi:hypothetical protein AAFF_G00184420 [Aldrovandia affinis]|uniref:Gypsy retrotransposon integrase-like protein 1 n=1 Tax=Aldrovandia affinis TaxID=143900 RepID=A0AAD7RK96_9TELE|nr:hypothetical protein AAFF_G00184420 [Aldrovandia affinis]
MVPLPNLLRQPPIQHSKCTRLHGRNRRNMASTTQGQGTSLLGRDWFNALGISLVGVHQSAPWQWNDAHRKAYDAAKQLLQSEDVLAHYDETEPLALVCDTSPYGLGALLFHMEPNGREAPICFASRALTSTERNYAQIDKEALAVIFAVKKYHQYISGRHFVVFTDHKPLLGLLHHSKPMPAVLSPGMLRWSVLLGAYDYELSYRPGKQLANADALSRLPLPTTVTETPPPLEVLLLEMVPEAPLHATRIAAITLKDPVLSHVLRWVLHGWPTDVPDGSFKPFISRRHELSAHKNCLLWGCRVVIPNLARKEVLAMLHDAHPGIVHMKGLARSYAWWPGMDRDVEETVNACEICQRSRHAPPTAQLHPWEFARRNSIRHVTTAPYHPSSNGQAERMVQTTKEALSRITVGDWQTRLARFLLSQHITPNSATGKSPAELLMNQRLTTALDRRHPDYVSDMHHKQEVSCEEHHGPNRSFQEDDDVYMRSYTGGHKWIPGVILPQSLKIMVTCQGYLRNHHWNRPRRQGREHQTLPITLWLEGVLVDPCVRLSPPLPYDVQRESVTRHGI